jgi:hypothetical protein
MGGRPALCHGDARLVFAHGHCAQATALPGHTATAMTESVSRALLALSLVALGTAQEDCPWGAMNWQGKFSGTESTSVVSSPVWSMTLWYDLLQFRQPGTTVEAFCFGIGEIEGEGRHALFNAKAVFRADLSGGEITFPAAVVRSSQPSPVFGAETHVVLQVLPDQKGLSLSLGNVHANPASLGQPDMNPTEYLEKFWYNRVAMSGQRRFHAGILALVRKAGSPPTWTGTEYRALSASLPPLMGGSKGFLVPEASNEFPSVSFWLNKRSEPTSWPVERQWETLTKTPDFQTGMKQSAEALRVTAMACEHAIVELAELAPAGFLERVSRWRATGRLSTCPAPVPALIRKLAAFRKTMLPIECEHRAGPLPLREVPVQGLEGAELDGTLSRQAPLPVVEFREQLGAYMGSELCNRVGVEVGSFAGSNLDTLLSGWQSAWLIVGLDSWSAESANNGTYVDRSGGAFRSSSAMDGLADMASSLASAHGVRGVTWREFSTTGAAQLPDESLDCVYLDARHDYTSVTEDLEAWWPKLRRGGVMAGHDFVDANDATDGNHWEVQPDGSIREDMKAVKGAVIDFARRRYRQIGVTFGGEAYPSWFIRK